MAPRRRVPTGVLTLFFALIAVCALVPRLHAQADGIAVIVNPNNPVNNLSLADLRKVFSGGKRSWGARLPVKLIVRAPGCPERLALLRLLGMSETDYKQYWTAQVFRGEADAEPIALPSFGMVKEAVVAFPGSISLVESDSVKPGMYVKVIKIDGHLPGDPGYPLH
jgi:ABC-type phosphate transport system substrate-binding protein